MAHGHNVIEAYCKICKKAITQATIYGGMAVKVGDNWIHIFHTQEAQKVLADEKYMDGAAEFVNTLDEMKKRDRNVSGDMAKKTAMAIANRRELDFDKLELAVKSFYSYSVAQIEKRTG